jgi:thiol:disulfide interchange protein DsbD
MIARILTAALTALFVIGGLTAKADAGAKASVEHVRLSAFLEAPLKPGQTSWVAIRQEIDPGWHTYWKNPGEAGIPTTVSWRLPDGVTAGAMHWPTPALFSDGTVTNYGYEKNVTLLIPLTASRTAKSSIAQVTVNLLACEHMCIPGQATLELDLQNSTGAAGIFAVARTALPVSFTGTSRFGMQSHRLQVAFEAPWLTGVAVNAVTVFPAAQSMVADGSVPRIAVNGPRLIWNVQAQDGVKPPQEYDGVIQIAGKGAYAFAAQPGTLPISTPSASPNAVMGLWAALGLAFLGGLILNLMPCVLPVLSMKALALARTAGDSASARREGLFYLAGVMTTFAVMAGLLLTLKASGAALGWGFQLQSPAVVMLLALLMAGLGLNLLGIFELPMGIAGVGDHLARSGGGKGAFFTGALAVIVASPCTAPFMGAALGFALTQPVWSAAMVFLALGLGFAAPFTALSAAPALIALIPKPGLWMNWFKQALAFPMFATAIWLLWVLGRQSGPDAVVAALGIALGLVIVVWLLQLLRGIWGRIVAVAGIAGVVAGVVLVSGTPAPTARPMWSSWSEQAVASARLSGRPVLVDFSAAWCVTCLVNERVALHSPQVQARLEKDNVVTLKGDWTNPDPAITAALHQYGQDGVPLYLLIARDGQVTVLPQILTPGIVVAALVKLER